MNRFYHESNQTWIRPLLSVVLFFLLFAAFFFSVNEISSETQAHQTELLRLSLSRGIANCYAAEGVYPESLEYLEEHYGISYDPDKYFIDYQVIGQNIFPDITIIEK